MGEEIKRGASGSEEMLSWRFPEGDLWSADEETFGRCMGRWFGSGPKMDREITERSDGVGHISSRRGPPGPIDMPHTPETSTKARRVVDTPAGVEKISSEECMAASSLIRWGGPAAVLGGLSTTFVSGLLPSPYPPNDGE